MIPEFKFLIREYIKEYIEKEVNPSLKDEELNTLARLLIHKLKNIGFMIKKSGVSFSNLYTFDAENLGKVYQIVIRKKGNNSLKEDNDNVQRFSRKELEDLYPGMFIKQVEYIVEFQDKANDFNIAKEHNYRKKFNGQKQSFQNFAEQFTSEIIKNFM